MTQVLPVLSIQPQPQEISAPEEPEPISQAEDMWDVMPAFDLSDLDFDLPGLDIDAAVPEEPVQEETPAPPPVPEIRPQPIRQPRQPEPPEPQTREVWQRRMPMAVGGPLFALTMLVLGVPLAILCVLLACVCLCPGLAGVMAAWLVFVGGLWCVGYMADAILMFGLSFVVLAVGIILLFAGVWATVQLVKLYLQGVEALSGIMLGKKVTVYV